MKPLPWTPSSLDTFRNCGLQFYHKYVAKDLPREPQTPQQIYGDRVHKAFEDRLNEEKPLPADLTDHEPFLARLEARAGIHWCEEPVALRKDLTPCRFEDEDRWWRGKIDFRKVDAEDPRATLVDYKTGKPHDKWEQLAQYAIHTFQLFPNVEIVDAKFYWTQTMSVTRRVWSRAEMPELWDMVLPDLKQMALAFKSDTWQERPSGLCHGFCPVKDCQHWRPARRR